MAIRKVCNELGLRFGRCEDDARAILKKAGIDALITVQLKKAMDEIEGELTLSYSYTNLTRQNMDYILKKWKMTYCKTNICSQSW